MASINAVRISHRKQRSWPEDEPRKTKLMTIISPNLSKPAQQAIIFPVYIFVLFIYIPHISFNYNYHGKTQINIIPQNKIEKSDYLKKISLHFCKHKINCLTHAPIQYYLHAIYKTSRMQTLMTT